MTPDDCGFSCGVSASLNVTDVTNETRCTWNGKKREKGRRKEKKAPLLIIF